MAVALSPLALGSVSGISDDWENLSFIGQTYGAASALLAGLALAGVVATLVLQARETRIARELALRDSNSELLRMAMENPEYARCWGTNLSPGGREQRQHMYTNMIVSQWEMAFESGAIGEQHVRHAARGLFAGRIGWEFWGRVREVRLRTAETRRSRRFHRMLDEEFQRSPEPPLESDTHVAPSRRPTRAALAAAAAFVVGAASAGVVARRLVLRRHMMRQGPAEGRPPTGTAV
ncbi:DUF6082 family protein [Streptomonospora sp. S1-112]|uniref:DUF6082 family protein n=1 Tax=Streptomonospora mangrovi TaxID=2883123 RepID=A0A9X3NPG4_9ACTN|nr:DUF6082 family protein [Streptomonospora mangrovi]